MESCTLNQTTVEFVSLTTKNQFIKLEPFNHANLLALNYSHLALPMHLNHTTIELKHRARQQIAACGLVLSARLQLSYVYCATTTATTLLNHTTVELKIGTGFS
jgi:hypothetical protein